MAAIMGYIRVSTLSQVNDGHGLDVQRDKIQAFCAYQGLQLDRIEEDAGISGASTDNRPGLRRALRSVLQSGAGSVLVVYRLDRLGRNAIDVQETLAVLLDSGVRVVSIADGVDSSSGIGSTLLKLLTSILATFAELEKETIRTRLLDGRRRADSENRVYAVEPSYGRRRVGASKNLETDPEESATIDRIRTLFKEGMTYRDMAAKLQQEGFHPRRGKAWSLSLLQKIATGRRAPRKTTAVGRHRLERAKTEILNEVGSV